MLVKYNIKTSILIVKEFGMTVAHLAWWVYIPSWQWRLVSAGYQVKDPPSKPGVSSLADQPNGSDVPSHHARATLQNPTTQTTPAYPPNPHPTNLDVSDPSSRHPITTLQKSNGLDLPSIYAISTLGGSNGPDDLSLPLSSAPDRA